MKWRYGLYAAGLVGALALAHNEYGYGRNEVAKFANTFPSIVDRLPNFPKTNLAIDVYVQNDSLNPVNESRLQRILAGVGRDFREQTGAQISFKTGIPDTTNQTNSYQATLEFSNNQATTPKQSSRTRMRLYGLFEGGGHAIIFEHNNDTAYKSLIEHELLHILGLTHSIVPGTIGHPYIEKNNKWSWRERNFIRLTRTKKEIKN